MHKIFQILLFYLRIRVIEKYFWLSVTWSIYCLFWADIWKPLSPYSSYGIIFFCVSLLYCSQLVLHVSFIVWYSSKHLCWAYLSPYWIVFLSFLWVGACWPPVWLNKFSSHKHWSEMLQTVTNHALPRGCCIACTDRYWKRPRTLSFYTRPMLLLAFQTDDLLCLKLQ